MDLAEYQRRYGEDESAAPGWDAIDSRLKSTYGKQEPKHWGTVISSMLGGEDPLHGISAYECRDGGRDHLHFCTYGYSMLFYDEQAVGSEYSGFGFEMTFRLASSLPPAEQPIWVCNLLQNLARYVFDSGNPFGHLHWIPANGPIYQDSDTALVGLAFVSDPTLPTVDSPHGLVKFIQAFGITQKELDAIQSKTRTCEEILKAHQQTNPLLVTDLCRKD